MADIQINFGNRPRRRRRRRALGGAAVIAALVAALFAYMKKPGSTPPAPRLPSAATAVERLAGFAPGLAPIPATVIEKGPLRDVPYLSYRAGDVEVNAYGDPDQPACLEIGIFGDASKRPAARDAMAALLGADLSGLKMARDKRVVNGLTIEITPETAEDAYGAWWVSVYDAAALDAQRAGEDEKKGLTAERPPTLKVGRPGKRIYVPSFRRVRGVYSSR